MSATSSEVTNAGADFISPDLAYMVREGAESGYRAFSILTPPAYLAFILYRRGRGAFSINRLLRATWVGGAGGGAACGVVAYGRYATSNPEFVRARRVKAEYSAHRVRRETFALTGGFLGAVLVPAVFWNRGQAVNLVLGGAGWGSGAGILSHFYKTFTDPPVLQPGQPPIPPVAVGTAGTV